MGSPAREPALKADGSALRPLSQSWLVVIARGGLGGHTRVTRPRGPHWARSAADGCYDAARTAGLSGVSRTAICWWARHGIVAPSVSPVREKLWSYSDLMALRRVGDISGFVRDGSEDPGYSRGLLVERGGVQGCGNCLDAVDESGPGTHDETIGVDRPHRHSR